MLHSRAPLPPAAPPARPPPRPHMATPPPPPPPLRRRPRVLVSNDDGIDAPGLRELVLALAAADCCDIYVSAPNGERSAQSHAITLGRYMTCFPTEVEGAVLAYAVEGTPADSVMLALNSDLLGAEPRGFDLVASGINRGDNNGMHVIYSGTVGAAREAAAKFLPAIAFSLDNHRANAHSDYAVGAAVAAALVAEALRALLGGGESGDGGVQAMLGGCVLNVNFPAATSLAKVTGLHLTRQGLGCVHPAFKEVMEAPGPHLDEIDLHTPAQRVYRNYAGQLQEDDTPGSDSWAVKRGWISVTPLGLTSHILPLADIPAAAAEEAEATKAVVGEILAAVGKALGLRVAGVTNARTAAAVPAAAPPPS